MIKRTRIRLLKTVWAYAYLIIPPQSADRLRTIRTLLDQEHRHAESSGRVWGGRVLHEPGNTFILIVSDSPVQNREVNRHIETQLTALQATFGVTLPMSVADDGAVRSPRRSQPKRSMVHQP
jgi:hypothetical protein